MATYLTHFMSDFYNIKVIEYGNGVVELRKYSNCIGVKFDELETDVFNPFDCENTFIDCYNPFTNSTQHFKDLDFQIQEEYRKAHCLKVSYNRTRNNLYKYLRMCAWQFFITLTFSPDVIDRFDFSACMKKANKWIQNQKFRYANDLQYILVPEHHRDGAWHIHGVLANVGNMSFIDSSHKDKKGRTVYNLSGWKNGFSTSTKVTDICKVSSYMTEYITKDLCKVTMGKHRYYRSNNISEPRETTFILEESSEDNFNCFIQKISDSFDLRMEYEKTVKGVFLDVQYIYFNRKGESDSAK